MNGEAKEMNNDERAKKKTTTTTTKSLSFEDNSDISQYGESEIEPHSLLTLENWKSW